MVLCAQELATGTSYCLGCAIRPRIEEVNRSNLVRASNVPALTRKTCACCTKPVNTSNPHAVFCSAWCAERAATHYAACKRTSRTLSFSVDVQDASHKVSAVADKALRFLAGLNLQDHSVKEQRESLAIVKELMDALKPAHKNEGRKK
jgi:hypothetical protein